MKRKSLASISKFLVISLSLVTSVFAADLDQVTRLSRQYLGSKDSAGKAALGKKIVATSGEWRQVIDRLSSAQYEAVKPSYYPEQHFLDPALKQSRRDDLLYFMVPTSYRADQPSALIVFMHGGGKGSPRTSPARHMNFFCTNGAQ